MTNFFDENDQLTVGWFYKTFRFKVIGKKSGVWVAKKASGVPKGTFVVHREYRVGLKKFYT
jgi:hypothetical protein